MARMTRTESRDLTRRMLRDAAMKEFARCGFGGTSAESIAEAAGFSSGAFYSNYRSKQEILVDVMRNLQQEESDAWQEVINSGATVDEVLVELATRAETFARQQEWLLLKVELELRAARDAKFREDYAVYRTELRQQALSVLTGLCAKAGKKVPPNIEIMADAWLAFSIGLGLYFIAESQAERRFSLRSMVFIPFLENLLAQAEPLAADVQT